MARHRATRRIAFLLLGVAVSISCVSVSPIVEVEPERPAPQPTVALDLATELSLDPAVQRGRLENGLTYYVRENTRPENRAELWLLLDAGSIQEDDDQQGLAHFVEHMAFNGTEHFQKQELIDYMERIGMRFGADLNAFTSFDETIYQLTLPTDDPEILEKGFLILEDWARGIVFDSDEIENERGVVIEEWRLHRGADARLRDKQFPILFKGSRYAERIPIGKTEIVESAPREALLRYYRDWYRPDLMAVVAVGDFDAAEIETAIRNHFDGLRPPENPRKRETYPVPPHDETLVDVATDPEATATRVVVLYKLERRPRSTVGDYRRSLVEGLYHSMLNSRLGELVQKPDPPFVSASSASGTFARSRDVYFQSALVEDGGIERGLDALLQETERIERHGFTATELARDKKEFRRAAERAYAERDKRRSGGLASRLTTDFLQGRPEVGVEVRLELMRELLPTIELDEMNHLARKWIGEGDRVILVTAPEKENVALPDEEALLAVFESVRQRDVDPYVDQVRDEPLVAEIPRPAEILERGVIDELGVTEWKLSNGIRVILKPTDFKNDEILLSGFSPGGHSLVPDEQHISAGYATSFLGAGGLGAFDRIELDKALAGKVAGAGVGIGELEESAFGSASPEDVETMFQLLYLSFTAPRKDHDAVSALLERQRAVLENRSARPGTVFNDRYLEVSYQKHFRRRPLTVEVLDDFDLDAALEIHRERFRDVGDFTFVLVGNFEPDGIESLVRTYIGGLPAAGREETWRDVGVHSPDAVIRFDVEKGLEPKSSVRLTFSGPAEWNGQAAYDIASLGQLLRMRLREVLREDLGATYGVSAGGGISRRPREEYRFTISFGCAPEAVDDLIDSLLAEIEALKNTPPDEASVAKVREGQTRSRETDLRENGFWRGQLSYHYRHGLDPRQILEYETLVESLSPERLQQAARLYLDDTRYVLGVLRPERGQTMNYHIGFGPPSD